MRKWDQEDWAYLFIGIAIVVVLSVVVVRAADEIQVTPQLNVEKGELELQRKPGTIDITMYGDVISDITQAYTQNVTSQVVIATGVASNGVVWFKNLTTNTLYSIEIGAADAVGTNMWPLLKLKATEINVGRLMPGINVYACPRGGNMNMRTIVVED